MRKNIIWLICLFVACGNPKSNLQQNAPLKQHTIPVLAETKWYYKISDDCVNYYWFKRDGQSVYYSCESDTKYYGKYIIKNDTIIIHNYTTDVDSLLSPVESSHRSNAARYKLILDNNKLKHVARYSFSKSDSTWVEDNFQFDEDFLFEKNMK